jgi:DNA-binding response OmpR family regulator
MESPAVAPSDSGDRFLTAGPFTFDRQKRVLIWADEAGRTAEFSEAEAAVLEVLMMHRDRVLSCHDMARLAWSYDLEEEEARGLLRQYVFRLRRKIEARPDDPAWIHTVRGRGYLFGMKDPGASTA